MELLQAFLLGFIMETVVSFDDTVSKIPLLLGVTRTRQGKIAFAVGSVIAVGIAILISMSLASIVASIPWMQYVSAGVIYLLAIFIAFNVFAQKEYKLGERVLKSKTIKVHKMVELFLIGLIISMVTLIDDTIVLIPLFEHGPEIQFWTAVGVMLSAILQVIVVIIFARQLEHMKYKRFIAVGGLIIFGTLLLFGLV